MRATLATLCLATLVGCAPSDDQVRDEQYKAVVAHYAQRDARPTAPDDIEPASLPAPVAVPADIGERTPVVAPPVTSSVPIDPSDTCALMRKMSVCVDAGDTEAIKRCLGSCIEKTDGQATEAAAAAETSCEDRLVNAGGKGPATCDLEAPPGPAGDRKAEETTFAREAKQALTAKTPEAMRAGLDKAFAGAFAFDARDRLHDCLTECARKAHERLQVASDGPRLVRDYKRCMVRADTTREARRLALFEKTLYREYREKADETCRKSSKCDWIEGMSEIKCEYDTPEWNQQSE